MSSCEAYPFVHSTPIVSLSCFCTWARSSDKGGLADDEVRRFIPTIIIKASSFFLFYILCHTDVINRTRDTYEAHYRATQVIVINCLGTTRCMPRAVRQTPLQAEPAKIEESPKLSTKWTERRHTPLPQVCR